MDKLLCYNRSLTNLAVLRDAVPLAKNALDRKLQRNMFPKNHLEVSP